MTLNTLDSGKMEFSRKSLAQENIGMEHESEVAKHYLHKYSLALTHLTNMTISFEGRFDSDPSQFSYEELSEVLDAEIFLKGLGREYNRVNEIEKEMFSRTI
jgi:hypothetical protein